MNELTNHQKAEDNSAESDRDLLQRKKCFDLGLVSFMLLFGYLQELIWCFAVSLELGNSDYFSALATIPGIICILIFFYLNFVVLADKNAWKEKCNRGFVLSLTCTIAFSLISVFLIFSDV